MSEVETEFVFEARVRLKAPILIGQTPEGYRMIVNVDGGTFAGPKLSGAVVANTGADWSRLCADGSGDLDVRFCLQTTDGALIYAHWHGVMAFDPGERDYALDFDKDDDPAGADRDCFRVSPRFETAHPDHAWLNRVLAISKSRTGGGGGVHRIFAVK